MVVFVLAFVFVCVFVLAFVFVFIFVLAFVRDNCGRDYCRMSKERE